VWQLYHIQQVYKGVRITRRRTTMKRLLLLSAAFALPAHAADMPLVKAAMAAPAPTGWYVDLTALGSVLKPGGAETLSPAGAGAAFGGGYDFTPSSGIVIGVLGNAGWVNVRGTAACAAVSCTSGNTWEGELGGRIGFTFATLNSALGSNTTFQNLNGKLVAPLVAVTPLNQAMIYAKVSAVVQDIKAAAGTVGASQEDIGLRLGAGVEMPVVNSWVWKTEVNYTKFNEAICTGCMVPTGRPAEWGAKTGIAYRF
jgi:opacity protein-like surface antigen